MEVYVINMQGVKQEQLQINMSRVPIEKITYD